MIDLWFIVSDTYDYAVPDISGISSCSAAHQPLLIQPVLQKQQHPHQPKLPAVSPPSMAIEIDTLASSSHSTTTNGSASSSSVRLGSGKINNHIGHYNGISESSPLKKVRETQPNTITSAWCLHTPSFRMGFSFFSSIILVRFSRYRVYNCVRLGCWATSGE